MPERQLELERKEGFSEKEETELYLKDLIRGMKPGDPFFSVRSLSRYLKVNRNTAEQILRKFTGEGILSSEPCIGYFVKESYLLHEPPSLYECSDAPFYYRASAPAFGAPYHPEYERFINLGCATPDPEILRFEKYLSLYQGTGVSFKQRLAGFEQDFNSTISRILLRRGISIPDANFCVIRDLALLLVVSSVIRKGDRVVMADWGDTEAEIAFLEAGAEIIYTGSDDEGMLVDELVSLSGSEKIRAVFIRPRAGVPACKRLSEERLNMLFEYAGAMDFVVIAKENEPDFCIDPIWPPQQNRKHFNRLVGISCICNVFPQYSRTDIVTGPADFISDLHLSSSIRSPKPDAFRSLVLIQMEEDGELQAQIKRLQNYYKGCRDYLSDAFDYYLGGRAVLTMPDEGLHAFIQFEKETDLSVLLDWMEEVCMYRQAANNHLAGDYNVSSVRLGFGFPDNSIHKSLFKKLNKII
ncbi:DNA-binding transcriptional MocR family regulator [Arcticibacter tournemirensis]|uniref:PLP-dependent aminotransferase family protein n=1 Tax=Arcticibacter tournemirensis TaxID=699437 RepID=A0A5M9GLU7_9SPHI|nr:hypothetical protein [Arcticibacter tournemirensis]KAA8475682.1 hypothetical protein F1649_21310 [Arcticibacter tournemirensis]TQM50775.1 DNA-binding transcriptional MocR family regulator [Arcticibacter tournemirensis]